METVVGLRAHVSELKSLITAAFVVAPIANVNSPMMMMSSFTPFP